MVTKFREMAMAATAYASNLGYNKAWVWEDALAEYCYQDILKVVAEQALIGKSAVDVFDELKRIYEAEAYVDDPIQRTPTIDDWGF